MMAATHTKPRPLLSQLLALFTRVEPAHDRQVAALGLDSRAMEPGALFCALPGGRSHGMDFAAQAMVRGAIAILAQPGGAWDSARIRDYEREHGVPIVILEGLGQRLSAVAGRFYGDPASNLDLIAVTGTNGKTSVCQFVAQALDGKTPCASIGTLGYGFPDAMTGTGFTTPDAVRLQAILAELQRQGARTVALEVSSHALDQGRAAALAVDTAIFTNLTREHLDYHGDMHGYAAAKRRLFQLPALRHAIVNMDDPFGREILAGLDPGVQAVAYGVIGDPVESAPSVGHWVRARHVQTLARGARVTVESSWGDGEFSTPLLGGFNVSNLMPVLAVLLLRGWDLARALERLGQLRGVPGRMESFGRDGQPVVVVDYAHTPDALEQALSVLREHRPRRLFCLFGCGGERDTGKRPLMGAVAERLSDRVILTDDNPRGEDGAHIIEAIRAGMQHPESVQVQRNRGRAIRYAVCLAGAGDMILVAGKGHETTQTVGDLVLPFSDRAQVVQVLNEWGGCPQ